jgi:hypothetical protein
LDIVSVSEASRLAGMIGSELAMFDDNQRVVGDGSYCFVTASSRSSILLRGELISPEEGISGRLCSKGGSAVVLFAATMKCQQGESKTGYNGLEQTK